MDRPELKLGLKGSDFKQYYYLKEELVSFCKEHNLQKTGSKIDLTNRIATFLDTGEKTTSASLKKNMDNASGLSLDTILGENFPFSQANRYFFQEHIGKTFTFNVLFQNWVKANPDKTVKEAIEAYKQIQIDKKKNGTTIDRQFQYNRYVRAFFLENKDKTLDDAIKCWKYKKSLKGYAEYSKEDLIALETKSK